MNKLLPLVLSILLAQAASAFGANSRSGVVTLTVDLSGQAAGQEARLWVPYPVSDRHQMISDIKVNGDFASSGVYTDRVNGTPMLYAEWPKEANKRTLTFSFAVERKEIRQTGLPTAEPAWNPADYSEYLQATSLGPVDGEVKKARRFDRQRQEDRAGKGPHYLRLGCGQYVSRSRDHWLRYRRRLPAS